MSFAKAFFDVGLFTNQASALRDYYQQLGLSFDHSLKLGGGVLQHRYQADDAVLKINDARDPLPEAPASALTELLIALPGCPEAVQKQDPDGNCIRLVPTGEDDIQGLALRMSVSDVATSTRFYTEVLGLHELRPGVLSCGKGLLLLQASGQPPCAASPLAARGLRYLTLQIFDCDKTYAHAIGHGATGVREPVNMGSTARIAFIQDPDGVWIELSQRASVTGKSL
ncbi:VOC family protein [Halopseudomonas laoshanensis]|jgi:catechol 2,3-dioxygenase-like lactoylglutathione lyase family enzyme|uniref:VOC family protein n=1 Tax=Halopseudomonas TaxID=2901189 RepID=UPI003736DDAE